MKNIAQYFEDSIKSNNEAQVRSTEKTKEETESNSYSKKMRNRVKIKISRTSAKERVCNILESSSDMIDKTPSPFAKVNNVDKGEQDTPKRSLSKLLLSEKHNTSSNQHLNYLTMETDCAKRKRQRKTDSTETFSNKNGKVGSGVNGKAKHDNDVKNDADIDIVDINSNDGLESSQDESNAFQILMGRNKPSQNISLTKLFPENEELCGRKSEEQKEKLKRFNEKLVALADKKGYSKRKLVEMEESDKIERTIQDRIKLFKGEEKKDSCVSATILNQKQPSGSLLNYFSKTPVNLMDTNMENLSTIVVKADVHAIKDSTEHNLYKSNANNILRPTVKNKKSDIELTKMDDIHIVESENINITNANNNKLQGELPKHRWALRIKLQEAENKNDSLGDSSDEELYSATSKVKLNASDSTKSGISISTDSENIQKKSKSKKGASKLKLKKHEKIGDFAIIEDDSNSENKLEKKQDKPKSTSVQGRKFNSSNNTNVENIADDETNEEDCIVSDNNSKRKTNDKLAPLFTKRKKPDPQVLAARRLFLQPNVADNYKKNTSRKINTCSILVFPLVSHITQLNDTVSTESNTFNIPRKICKEYVPILNVSNYKHLIDYSETKIKPLENFTKPNMQEILADIEKRCPNAKQMWEVISHTVKGQQKQITHPKARAKKKKHLEKTNATESKEEQLKYCSWTLKYRPKSTQEVVGNEEAAIKLREWLIGWRATFTHEDVSSGDEFYSSDSNHSKIIENNQVAVLIGPHGSGKTASVYAVAEEFGYNILELNASSRRTGKRIFKELDEATKSHRIKKDDKTSSSLGASLSHEIMPKKIPQNSLILIEDIDIVFEEDEGFVSGTYQLASSTKRPIVMTCRDVWPHLSKMAPQQNRIYFQNVVGDRVTALLELISLAETGCRLPSNYITELLQSGDLRKAILQLQYLLLSGPPRMLEQSINLKNAFWQNMRYWLYKPAINIGKKQKKRRTLGKKVTNDNKNIIIDIAGKLDNIALMSSLVNIEDSALNSGEIKMQPNLSLIENTAPYSASSNVSLEIANWIGNKVMYKDQLNERDKIHSQNTVTLKKQLNKGVNLALSQTTSLLLDRHILATDYLPSMRSICRAEESRATANNKRGNRFFHYLHNLKTSSTLLRPNILGAACKIMYDKVDSTIQTGVNNGSIVE